MTYTVFSGTLNPAQSKVCHSKYRRLVTDDLIIVGDVGNTIDENSSLFFLN